MESNKKKTNKVPMNVSTWYNKLYLERKGSTKSKFPNKVTEASKSWLSLNESEKKYFYTKFEECRIKYNEEFVTCLQKAEPFMKEKVPSGKSNSNTVIYNEDNQHASHTSEENELPIVESDQQQDTEYVVNSPKSEAMPEETALPSVEPDQQENSEYGLNRPNNEEYEQNTKRNNRDPSETMEEQENSNNSQEDVTFLMSEPTPPNVKSGKELFEFIRLMGEKNNSAWMSLSPLERSRYNQVVLSLKKDYIQKYTTYLENLSQRDLFDHYNKIFI